MLIGVVRVFRGFVFNSISTEELALQANRVRAQKRKLYKNLEYRTDCKSY